MTDRDFAAAPLPPRLRAIGDELERAGGRDVGGSARAAYAPQKKLQDFGEHPSLLRAGQRSREDEERVERRGGARIGGVR